MKEPFNKLSLAEAERLALLAEECGEIIQAVGKILRHGYAELHPAEVDGPDNRSRLEKELGDAQHVINRMLGAGDVRQERIVAHCHMKAGTVGRYLHHQGTRVEP